jgi:hypothetical protein
VAEELARSLAQLFDRDTFQLAPLLVASPKAARNQLVSVSLLVHTLSLEREDVFGCWNLWPIRGSGIRSGIHHRRNHSFWNEWQLVITSLLQRIHVLILPLPPVCKIVSASQDLNFAMHLASFPHVPSAQQASLRTL